MKRVVCILRVELAVSILMSLGMIMLYETELLLGGGWKGSGVLEYVFKLIMEILTLCLIPLALRLFKDKSIQRSIKSHGVRGLLLWSSVRLSMLCVPMVLNTWLYYQFMSPAFGYLAIIDFLSLFFITPSTTRCKDEMR